MTDSQKLLQVLEEGVPEGDLLPNPHPGETIREGFLEPWGMTPYRLARLVDVPPTRVDQILKGRRAITADTAVRLSRAIGCSPEFWLGLQMQHDLEAAVRRNAEEYRRIHRYRHDGPLLASEEDAPAGEGEERVLAEQAAAS
jgi:antitoxin HigA-1